jgi:hypothetical protein
MVTQSTFSNVKRPANIMQKLGTFCISAYVILLSSINAYRKKRESIKPLSLSVAVQCKVLWVDLAQKNPE